MMLISALMDCSPSASDWLHQEGPLLDSDSQPPVKGPTIPKTVCFCSAKLCYGFLRCRYLGRVREFFQILLFNNCALADCCCTYNRGPKTALKVRIHSNFPGDQYSELGCGFGHF